MRPSNICVSKLRSVACQKSNPLKIQNKEMLRDLVTDFIIRSFSNKNPSLSKRGKQPKYEPLSAKIEINGGIQYFEFPLPMILQKYVKFEKASMENQGGIEPMILDILEFIDKLEDNASKLCLQLDGNVTPDIVLATLVSKHSRDKKKLLLQGEYELAKSKIYTKYKKVSYVAIDDEGVNRRHCQMLIDRISQDSSVFPNRNSQQRLSEEQLYRKHLPKPAISKLKLLVDSCNVFQHSEKLEALRRQKLINTFCKNQEQFDGLREAAKNKTKKTTSGDIDPGTAKMLEDWIADIQLSDSLFKRKYFPDKQNKTITEEGSSSEEEEIDL